MVIVKEQVKESLCIQYTNVITAVLPLVYRFDTTAKSTHRLTKEPTVQVSSASAKFFHSSPANI